ncbi:hypothetical protein BGW80DRAFT_1365764, partial [Lactifluus volemus]
MRRAASTTQPLCGPQLNYQRLCQRVLFLAVKFRTTVTLHSIVTIHLFNEDRADPTSFPRVTIGSLP